MRVIEGNLQPARRSPYNWDMLLDGRQYEFEQGVDYKNGQTFRSSAFSAAKKRGLKVRIYACSVGLRPQAVRA